MPSFLPASSSLYEFGDESLASFGRVMFNGPATPYVPIESTGPVFLFSDSSTFVFSDGYTMEMQ